METLRVLVTDDEPGMRLGVARALRDYTVFLPDVKDDVAFKSIKEGLKKDDKVLMAPITGLTDDQIKSVVAYIHTLQK